jgi:hypothetical protein
LLSQWEAAGIVIAKRERIIIKYPHGLVSIAEELPASREPGAHQWQNGADVFGIQADGIRPKRFACIPFVPFVFSCHSCLFSPEFNRRRMEERHPAYA